MANIAPEEKLLNLIKQGEARIKSKRQLKVFTRVNIALICVIAVVLAIFIIDLFMRNDKIPEINVDLPKQASLPVPKDIDIDAAEERVDEEKEPIFSPQEAAKDLNLLGIIAGANNQAIIEDKKINKTFFLYKGDSFGEFRVNDIKENQVILDYKGETIRLNM